MRKQILEQVLEHILNKEESQAQDLLHSFFVEKGRSIYESLITSDELAEDEVLETEELVDDAQDDFAGDISSAKNDIENEEMFSEEDEDLEDEENLEMGDDEFGGEEEDMGGDEGADEDKIDDAILDVEDALDELKSLFAQLKGDEAGEEEHAGEEMGGEEDMGEAVDFDELDESAQLLAAPKPELADTAGNKKSPIANLSKKDMKADPVALGGGAGETGGSTPSSKDMGVNAGNEPGQKTAPKLQSVKVAKGGDSGNTRSPIAGR